MIDTHAHLNYEPLNKDLEAVLDRAAENGVGRIIVPGTNVESSRSALEMVKVSTVEAKPQKPLLYAAVGFHPLDADQYSENSLPVLQELKKLGVTVTAIGEVGLDYYYFDPEADPRDIDIQKRNQEKILRDMIGLAAEWELPLILHSRSAHADMYSIVKECGAGERSVVHCFTGTYEEASDWLDLGCHISLTGIITYKKNQDLRDTVAKLPLERLMVETDAPYLPPEGYRSETCEPRFVVEVARCLAQIKEKTLEEIEQVTDSTAIRFFSL